MEKKKFVLKGISTGANKAAELFGKTKEKVTNIIDQDDDGKISTKDVAIVADTIGGVAKNKVTSIKDNLEERNREKEKESLQPIFSDDLNRTDFLMSKLIRITGMDKKRQESEVCQDSIGFIVSHKDELTIVNMFPDKLDEFGLSFYPDENSEVYYMDPCDRDRYIALDNYFGYMKEARVNELQKIAQDLGAKHFRVTYKEYTSSFSSNNVKAKGFVKGLMDSANASAEHSKTVTNSSTIEISAEASFPGHDPVKPSLKYLKKEPSIQNLIAMRMDEKAPLSHQKYTIDLNNSSGIKVKDAMKIDAALKSMKVDGHVNVESEAKNEARRFFEYEIDF